MACEERLGRGLAFEQLHLPLSRLRARAFGRDPPLWKASWPAAHAAHQQIEYMAAPTRPHTDLRSSLPKGSRPPMAQSRHSLSHQTKAHLRLMGCLGKQLRRESRPACVSEVGCQGHQAPWHERPRIRTPSDGVRIPTRSGTAHNQPHAPAVAALLTRAPELPVLPLLVRDDISDGLVVLRL